MQKARKISRKRTGNRGGSIQSDIARILSIIDGKSEMQYRQSRNSTQCPANIERIHNQHAIVPAQESIHEKTNEIPVFQEMLTYLDVEGKTITADAMHCQRETSRRIIQGKGDYLFGLKENQPNGGKKRGTDRETGMAENFAT